MSKKGVYPYDFMDSFEKFNQTELPTKEKEDTELSFTEMCTHLSRNEMAEKNIIHEFWIKKCLFSCNHIYSLKSRCDCK